MARYIDANKKLDTLHSQVEAIRKLIENRPYDEEAELILRELKYCISELDNTPTADVVEVKQIEIIRDDLKWWLETNTEKGVVYIPEFVVENMIAKMDGQRK